MYPPRFYYLLYVLPRTESLRQVPKCSEERTGKLVGREFLRTLSSVRETSNTEQIKGGGALDR